MIDESVIANLRAEWARDSRAHSMLLSAHEIDTLLAAAAERTELRRQSVAETEPPRRGRHPFGSDCSAKCLEDSKNLSLATLEARRLGLPDPA
jgi:hypothetical protein